MRRNAKVDRNHADIVAALRKVGVSVQSLAQIGRGCPDLLCSYRGRMTLLEVKVPGETLNPLQVSWFATWDAFAPVYVVETIDDALLVTREERDDDSGTCGTGRARRYRLR